MDWFTGIAVYITIWWICLFCILPIGARSQAEMGDITPGTDPGAPVIPNLKKKVLWTSGVALIVWSVLATVIQLDLVSLEHPLGALVR
jgi:predicted secreted protein